MTEYNRGRARFVGVGPSRGHLDGSNRGRGRARFSGPTQWRAVDHNTFINRSAIVDRRFSNGAMPLEPDLECASSSSAFPKQPEFQHPSYRRNRPDGTVREFPQDKPFFCEKCFYGYDKQRQYEDHLKTHIKCTQDGCKFEANPWTMAKHMMKSHEFSIGKGSEASNDRWVNDRKRKFPSNSVVAEKLEAEKNKTSRGEIIVAKNNFGKFKIDESNDFKRKCVENETDVVEIENGEISSGIGKNKFRSNSKEKKPDATLLEMLLQDDIVHERNVLYQCIRYIVHNNFFDKKPI